MEIVSSGKLQRCLCVLQIHPLDHYFNKISIIGGTVILLCGQCDRHGIDICRLWYTVIKACQIKGKNRKYQSGYYNTQSKLPQIMKHRRQPLFQYDTDNTMGKQYAHKNTNPYNII